MKKYFLLPLCLLLAITLAGCFNSGAVKSKKANQNKNAVQNVHKADKTLKLVIEHLRSGNTDEALKYFAPGDKTESIRSLDNAQLSAMANWFEDAKFHSGDDSTRYYRFYYSISKESGISVDSKSENYMELAMAKHINEKQETEWIIISW